MLKICLYFDTCLFENPLTWIESFPYREAKGEYVFFMDFDGHRDDLKVRKSITAMEELCDEVHVLGSFPIAKPTEE